MKRRLVGGAMVIALLFSMVIGLSPQVNAASMTVSDALVEVLKTMEGFREKPYWDNLQWTVGYGTECPADKVEEYKVSGISREEAQKLLEAALERFETAVNDFADTYDLKLKQNQFDALVSFSYNCGTAWMYETTGYFNVAVREGDLGSAFLYGICLYSSAGGDYILMERRLCEANMYINGVYKAYNDGGEGYPSNYKWVFLDGNGGRTRYVIYGYDATKPEPVSVSFSSIPTGVDAGGDPFVYELVGWYTADGVQVETLDESLENGQVLYAQWQDPDGETAELSKGQPTDDLQVTVTADTVNVRSGPGTYYFKLGSVSYGTALTVKEVFVTSSYTWGKTDRGWLSLAYTDYDQVLSEKEQYPKHGTVNATEVNYRTEPVVSSATWAGQMNKGDRVEITEEYYDGSMWWGKMANGCWICLDYVTYDEDVPPEVTGIRLLRLPDQTEYIQKTENLKLEGSILLVSYADGTSSALTLTREMVSGFSNENLGSITLTATYEGLYVNFKVNIVKAGDAEQIIVPDSITSAVYKVSGDMIRKIPAGTTVSTMISGIQEKDYVAVYTGNTQVSGDTPVSTGMTVKLLDGSTVKRSVTVVVTGDVNGDGKITVTDMLNIKSHLLGKSALANAYAQAADCNGDGAVSITDFIQLKAQILGKSSIVPN